MSALRRPLLAALLATLATSSGCSIGDKSDAAKVSFNAASDTAMVLGPDDVKVTSTDNAIVLAVIGDTVRMQLGDSIRNAVKQELDTAGKDSKFASAIVKSVGNVVNSALSFVVRVHVDDVENLRYEDGHIRFNVRGNQVNMSSHGGKANDAAFSPEDAMRFIDAVTRRQNAMNQ